MQDPLLFLIYIDAFIYGACLVCLLVVSALISGSETAFFSLSPKNIVWLENNHSKKSKTILRLLENPERLLSTILIVNNLVNIAAILVANELINLLFIFDSHTTEFIAKTIALTFFLLLFGEVMPKILANLKPISFAALTAPALALCNDILKPFSWVLIKIGGQITSKISTQHVSLNQIQDAIEITKTDSAEDKRMLSGIARISSTDVAEICIPRIDVIALDIDTPFDEVLDLMVRSGFSRIPVYKGDFDHVEGVLYIKDLLPYINQDNNLYWQKLIRKAYFVPEYKKIDDLLTEFRKRQIHLAIVVDEYGGTIGIATLEDILEEIVGEITDEYDNHTNAFQRIDLQTFIFEAKTHLPDFLRAVNLPQNTLDAYKDDADTLAGLLLEVKGEFLTDNETIVIENITFVASEIEGRRITKVKVKLPIV